MPLWLLYSVAYCLRLALPILLGWLCGSAAAFTFLERAPVEQAHWHGVVFWVVLIGIAWLAMPRLPARR